MYVEYLDTNADNSRSAGVVLQTAISTFHPDPPSAGTKKLLRAFELANIELKQIEECREVCIRDSATHAVLFNLLL